VENPHPVFVHFIAAAKEYAEGKNTVKSPSKKSEMI
jgi:CTP synthase